MIKPISLRLRNAEILAKARAALGNAREARLKQSHTAAVMRRARATGARAKEQNRLKRCAVLAAQKAILAVREAYAAPRQSRRRVCEPGKGSVFTVRLPGAKCQ
jgi:hypothetical protein